MFERYFRPDRSDPQRPSFQAYIFCGDGRFFSGFRHVLIEHKLLSKPLPDDTKYTGPNDVGEHGSTLFFEAIGSDTIKLHPTLTMKANFIEEDKLVITRHPIVFPLHEIINWIKDQNGPCNVKYLIDNQLQLLQKITLGVSRYESKLAYILKSEWDPYLAGTKIFLSKYLIDF